MEKVFESETITPTPYIPQFDNTTIKKNLERILSQTFKLLPTREENADYIKPLETLYIELLGMSDMLKPEQPELLSLVCKLNGLKVGGEDIEFPLYRRTIFECCGIIDNLKQKL